jgi:hypothetical protein
MALKREAPTISVGARKRAFFGPAIRGRAATKLPDAGGSVATVRKCDD